MSTMPNTLVEKSDLSAFMSNSPISAGDNVQRHLHGMTAIAALTAQNTVGVTGVHTVPAEFIVEQVRAVAEDIGVDAVRSRLTSDFCNEVALSTRENHLMTARSREGDQRRTNTLAAARDQEPLR